jgi:hypothetical protein
MLEWLFVDYKEITKAPWLFREDKPYGIRKEYKIGL